MSQVKIRSEYGYKWEVLFLIRSKTSSNTVRIIENGFVTVVNWIGVRLNIKRIYS